MYGLKQRLVGAFVILSLVVIFLPMIFDRPRVETTVRRVVIPLKPSFEAVVVKKPRKPVYQVIDLDKSGAELRAAHKKSQNELKVSSTPKLSASSPTTASTSLNAVSVKKQDKTAPKKRLMAPSVSQMAIFKNVWMVQLGTFVQVDNAYKLRDRLRAGGFDGHTQSIMTAGKKAIRVFTGPFLQKSEANRIKQQVDKKYKVDSLLIFFDP